MATASGVQAALALISTLPVDVVLTDIQMPNGNGFLLLEQIRRISRVPVIAVTANGLYSSQHFMEKGFAAHLPKPFVKAQLNRVLAPLDPLVPYDLFSLSDMGKMVEGDLDAVTQVLRVFFAAAGDSVNA
ncbi:response regulator, partial [Escherichia coli]